MSTPSIRVAVTQAEPEWLDLPGTIKKTVGLIAEAAQGGARLIAFPEVWITGYPGWIWTRPVDPAMNTKYIYNSLALDSPEFEQLKQAAKEHSICVALGFSERSPTNSLYISQAIISPQGELVMKRRKLKPTHMERTVFGDGSGSDLNNVVDIDFGAEIGTIKIGTLACWEHTQPLLKYHTYSQGEVIHISMWPPVDPHGGVESPGLWSMSADGVLNLSQTYAVEGGAYVLHCTAVCSQKGIDTLNTKGGLLFQEPGGGDSAVVGPDGRRLTEPLKEGAAGEGLVYADLDLSRGVTNRAFIDVVGHYSRPDLLWLGVDKQEKKHVVTRNGAQE